MQSNEYRSGFKEVEETRLLLPEREATEVLLAGHGQAPELVL